jgi:hypothetical protein
MCGALNQSIARELWYDNLATAVAEHDGNLVASHRREPELHMAQLHRAALAMFPALLTTISLGETITGLTPTGEGATSNQAFLFARRNTPKLESKGVLREAAGAQPKVVSATG